MADFAPPSGPPPPKTPDVPTGWKAVWNEQYKEWFYVNLHTKQSQWDRPTSPVYPPPGAPVDHAPDGPPAYDNASSKPVGPEKGAVSSHSTGEQLFNAGGAGATGSRAPDTSADEEFARKLQEEENARHGGGGGGATGDRGQADSYYNQGGNPGQYGGQQSPYNSGQVPQGQIPDPSSNSGSKSRGFLGKLLGKGKSSSQQPQYAQQNYGYGQGPPPQGYQQGYGQQGYPPQGYQPGYGPPPGGYYGGGGPQMGYGQQQPPRKGGLGAGGAAALGLGGGLLGGMLLGEAMDGGDGGGYGGDDGGGGGDFGGGDF